MTENHGSNNHGEAPVLRSSGDVLELGKPSNPHRGGEPRTAHHADKPRTAHHADQTKRSLTARLRRVEGQVRGIAGMVERDVYCDDVLHQIAAVEAALGGVRRLLLEAHIRSCVVEQVREGRDEVIDELMTTIGKMSR